MFDAAVITKIKAINTNDAIKATYARRLLSFDMVRFSGCDNVTISYKLTSPVVLCVIAHDNLLIIFQWFSFLQIPQVVYYQRISLSHVLTSKRSGNLFRVSAHASSA